MNTIDSNPKYLVGLSQFDERIVKDIAKTPKRIAISTPSLVQSFFCWLVALGLTINQSPLIPPTIFTKTAIIITATNTPNKIANAGLRTQKTVRKTYPSRKTIINVKKAPIIPAKSAIWFSPSILTTAIQI
jgi:hypothetical protein